MSNTLLPKNSTPLEKAIDTQSQRIDALSVNFADVIDAEYCPLPFLPWLAWSRRVEYWDGQWSETKKRAVVKDARAFNAQRGTKTTLAQAMDNLGIGHSLLAWHELYPKGTPHTFTVKVTSGRINVQQQQEIYTALDSVKSARDQFSIDASVISTVQLTVAGACRTGNITHISTPIIEEQI